MSIFPTSLSSIREVVFVCLGYCFTLAHRIAKGLDKECSINNCWIECSYLGMVVAKLWPVGQISLSPISVNEIFFGMQPHLVVYCCSWLLSCGRVV